MSTSERGLKGEDYVFETPPWWAVGPLKRVLMDLTYNEVHAMELGLVGVLAGVGWWYGLHEMVAVFTVGAIGIAFGLRRLPESKPIAARVIRMEPWYFSLVYVVSAVLASGVLEVLA